MANIDKELNQIKNAIYGREVRGSIHDGIKKINDEVEDSTETSEQAKHQVENIQEQVDNLVVSGDSSVEAAQARVDKDNHNYSTLKERLDTEQQQFETQLADKVYLQKSNFLVNIPTDYESLQEAVDALSKRKTSNGVSFTLKIETGHQIKSGLKVENGDFGNFEIVSDDPVVYLSEDFIGITDVLEGNNPGITSYLFLGFNARMPILSCLIDMDGRGSAGYYAASSSFGLISPNAGIKNAPFVGIEARSSIVSAETTITDGSFYGYRAEQGGVIFAQNGSANNCQSDGLLASRGSKIIFSSGQAINSGDVGARAQRSQIVCIESDFSGATGHGIYASEGSTVTAKRANVSNSGSYGFFARSASTIDAHEGVASECESGAVADHGSRICFYEGYANKCDVGVLAKQSSSIDFYKGNADECRQGVRSEGSSDISFAFGSATDCTHSGVYCSNSSIVDAGNASLNNASNFGIYATRSSNVNAQESDASGSGTGYRATYGSVINAVDSIGTKIPEPNTLSQSGIIYAIEDE